MIFDFVVGIALGLPHEFSALAILEQRSTETADGAVWHYACRQLQRWEPGTPYPVIVDEVVHAVTRASLWQCRLVVDQTDVGAAVVNLFRARLVNCILVPVLLTGGQSATFSNGHWHVPRKELGAVLVALLQTRRLTIAPSLSESPALRAALQTFRVKVSADDITTDPRGRDRDDLVLAIALAAWRGEREPPAIDQWGPDPDLLPSRQGPLPWYFPGSF